MDRVIEAANGAYERMFDLLFRPFDLVRYLLFAVLTFFASCGDPSTAQTNFSSADAPPMELTPEQMAVFGAGLLVALVIGLGVMLIGLVIWAGLAWVSSRATLMLIDGIVTGDPKLESWNRNPEAANALFKFRLVLGLVVALLIVAAVLVVGISQLGTGLLSDELEPFLLVQMLTSGLFLMILVPVTIVVWILDRLAIDLLAPVLYVEGGGIRSAAAALRSAERFEAPELALYLVMRVLVWIVVTLVTIPLICLCFCLMLIPGVGAVILLPFTLFVRNLSLQWVGRLDDRYSVLLGAPVEQRA